MTAMTRDDYAKLSTEELNRRLVAARERMASNFTDTTEAYLADAFAEQELVVALAERNELGDE